jgi:hypothetical protein
MQLRLVDSKMPSNRLNYLLTGSKRTTFEIGRKPHRQIEGAALVGLSFGGI